MDNNILNQESCVGLHHRSRGI